jgi:type II secretory pathway pseudopilin PulG
MSKRDQRRSEAGETLVELLVAIVIIGLAFPALIGALITSVAGSVEHRGLAAADTLLRSFAETVKYDVQRQLPPASPLFASCASTYKVLGSPNPSSATVGSTETLFGTGLDFSAASVTVGGNQATVIPGSTSSVTFVVPPAQAGANAVVLTVGGTQTTAAVPLNVTPSAGSLSHVSGPTGMSVTLAANGFKAGTSLSVTVGGKAATVTAGGTTGTTTGPNGTIGSSTVTFSIPSTLGAGGQPVVVSDGANSATSATPFTVNPILGGAGPAAPVSASGLLGYSLTMSVSYWDAANNQFDSTCTGSETQLVTLTASAPGKSAGTLSFVVMNPIYANPSPAPSVSVSSGPANPTTGATITFTANVTSVAAPAPSGNVSWTFTSGPGSPTCPNSALTPGGGMSAAATCTVPAAAVGTYAVNGTYLGDLSNASATAPGTITVSKAAPTIALSGSPATPVKGQTVVYTATVTGPPSGPTPTGTIAWNITAPSGRVPCASQTPLTGSSNSAQATCTITASSVGGYTATASVATDTSYYAAGPSNAVTFTVRSPLTITALTLANHPGGTAGKMETGDTITVTLSNPLNPNTICSSWANDSNDHSDSTATVQATASGGNTVVGLSAWANCPTFNIGSISLNKAYVSSTQNFVNSTVTYNHTADTVTITLGTGGSGSAPVTKAVATLTASVAVQDIYGQSVSNSPFATALVKQF